MLSSHKKIKHQTKKKLASKQAVRLEKGEQLRKIKYLSLIHI